jgi:hypothetical protein
MLHNIKKYPVDLKPMRRFTDPYPGLKKNKGLF